jgi:hypothetical protein
MISFRTKILLVVATFFGGLMAGLNVDRAFVAMPAWQQLGPLAWATFSQKADLGNGLFLYPFEAIVGTLLNIGTLVSYRFDKVKTKSRALPLYLAALLSIGGLLVTVKAAPIMLSVPHLGGDPLLLQKAFDGFNFWGGIRGLSQLLAFVAELWAIFSLL